MILKKFYEELGKFLYAVARSDGEIQLQEQKAIENEIHDILREYPDFEIHPEFKFLLLTKINFYNSLRENQKIAGIMKSFLDFVDTNRDHVPPESKRVALQLIRKAAEAYKGVNGMEHAMIAKLVDQLLVDVL